ncbi:MAG: hypothetical protein JXB38_03135 [Anaerolineales bacterium]|nr:hypothetical protein [Anaerolineales bacterium]
MENEGEKRKLEISRVDGSGPEHKIGKYTLTPKSQAVVLRVKQGGAMWQRPVGVTVDDGEGEYFLPIIDYTRIIQAGLLAASAFLAFFYFMSMCRKGVRNEQ